MDWIPTLVVWLALLGQASLLSVLIWAFLLEASTTSYSVAARSLVRVFATMMAWGVCFAVPAGLVDSMNSFVDEASSYWLIAITIGMGVGLLHQGIVFWNSQRDQLSW